MLEENIKAVTRLYGQLDRHLSAYKRMSCLECIPGCGECCIYEDLQATVLEFLPAAYNLFLQGEAEGLLAKLEQNSGNTCVFYHPFQDSGHCTSYQHRGLICRLFGFSARLDKHENRSLVACRMIKEMVANHRIHDVISHAPIMSSYYLRLSGIDPVLSVKYMHVNEAIKEAVETVLFRSRYRKKPA